MKKLLTSLIVATCVLAAIAVHQRRQVGVLTDANTSLKDQLAQVLAREAARPRDPQAGKLSEELLTELLGLRAEVARRPKSSPRMQAAQVAQLQNQVTEQAAQLAAAEAEAEYRKQIIARVNSLKMLVLAARVYAADNADRMPANFDMMRAEMNLDAQGNLPEGLPPHEFEFFPQPRPMSESEPHLILFREKNPVAAPNGKGTRLYGMIDGSVQQVSNDRITQFEREGTATGAGPAEEATATEDR